MYIKPNTDIAAFIFRSSLGIVLLAHSVYLKLMIFTLPGTAQFFNSIGLPSLLAYGVFISESVAGIALLLGVYSRVASLVMIPVLAGATWAHWSSGWLFTNTGGGWEYPLVLTFMAIGQFFLGSGRYALISEKQGA